MREVIERCDICGKVYSDDWMSKKSDRCEYRLRNREWTIDETYDHLMLCHRCDSNFRYMISNNITTVTALKKMRPVNRILMLFKLPLMEEK